MLSNSSPSNQPSTVCSLVWESKFETYTSHHVVGESAGAPSSGYATSIIRPTSDLPAPSASAADSLFPPGWGWGWGPPGAGVCFLFFLLRPLAPLGLPCCVPSPSKPISVLVFGVSNTSWRLFSFPPGSGVCFLLFVFLPLPLFPLDLVRDLALHHYDKQDVRARLFV